MSESVNKKYRWCRGGGKTPTFDFEDSVDPQKENYKRPQAVTESYKVAFSQSVQIPNNSLGGEKKGISSTVVGFFLKHFRGGFELVTAAGCTWCRRFWACLYPVSNSRLASNACSVCGVCSPRRGRAQVGVLISRRSWQQLQGGLCKMLHLQRDMGQKCAAFCSVGAFLCKTCTFKRDLNVISRW